MPKMDGEKKKKKILKVAEELFSENGFDATSVDKIARAAGVNKALIYYHFKDKNDIIASLFKKIIAELAEYLYCSFDSVDPQNQDVDIREKIKEEIQFLAKRKKILSVMLMESFKTQDQNNFLFKCAEIVINHEHKGLMKNIEGQKNEQFPERQQFFVYEFFTGVIPLIVFVAFQDKWSEYFNCESDKALEYFIDSFKRSHLASHFGAE